MKLSKNKWCLGFGSMLILLGLFLTIEGLAAQGHPAEKIWLKLGPLGLMTVVGGVALLFFPEKIKL
jgi:hypothetical protein